jgi:2-keto-4-pentenoate hydratase/2-oxohepta-3-ene-1,7-dioic acid hydratase in catechol pathway
LKLITYRNGADSAVGVMVDESGFVPLAAAAPDLPHSIRGLLEMGDGLEKAAAATTGKAAEKQIGDVTLLPVIPNPRAIWCIGVNYDDHRKETGRDPSAHPMIFVRVPQCQIAHHAPIIKPKVSEQLDFEGELVVIIGTGGRHIAKEDAFKHIAGYSIYNEGSVRDWQRHTVQFTPGKNFDDTGAFGPWMVTADEFGDPYSHSLTTRLNGEQMQHTSIDLMTFKIEELIAYISTFTTMRPGDIISSGTPGGVGSRRDPQVWMKPGDIVTVEISGIGTLENPIAAET